MTPYKDELALAALAKDAEKLSPDEYKIYEELLAVPDMEYTPKTDEEILQLARDLYKEQIWACSAIADEARMTFLPLMLMEPPQLMQLVKIGAYCYQHMDKAGPRSVNGMPSFFSMSIVSFSDWTKVFEKYKSIIEAVEGASRQN